MLIVSISLPLQGLADPCADAILKINSLLKVKSTLTEKAKGFALARKFNNHSVNKALLEMLDDPSPKGRISSDQGLDDPWKEAIHILLGRFSELEINQNKFYDYTEQDKKMFKEWWAKNSDSIIYRKDGTHFLKTVLEKVPLEKLPLEKY